jgi:prepilin-type N-terminal cleavage/methylation domain-containing protein
MTRRRIRVVHSRGAGFTLFEVLLVVAIAGILALLGLPALQQMIQRSKSEGMARNTTAVMRAAQLEAVRRGVPVGVQMDFATSRVFTYVENDFPFDGFTSGSDEEQTQLPLPGTVSFKGPTPGLAYASVGFAETAGQEGYAIFLSDGSVDQEGAFRFGDQRDNLLEIRVAPAATARVTLRKYEDHGMGADWYEQGEGGVAWSWN